jgi:hypothetical protein
LSVRHVRRRSYDTDRALEDPLLIRLRFLARSTRLRVDR